MTRENLNEIVERAREILATGSTLSFDESTVFSVAIIQLAHCVDQLTIVQTRCTELLEETRALKATIATMKQGAG
jgi:uncharacterized membrane protein